MPVEIEAKMRCPDHEPIRAQLRTAGAVRVGLTLEVNRFYDAPAHNLRAGDQGLRIRTNQNAETGEATHVVTFKGRRQAGKFKTREELEFSTDEADATATIFERLGYPLELLFEKRRETWQLGGCEVVLDELPQLGKFIEIEGPDEAMVEAVQETLAIQDEPSLQEGYASMIATHLAKTGGRELRF